MSLTIERHYLLLMGNCSLNDFLFLIAFLFFNGLLPGVFMIKKLVCGHGLTLHGTLNLYIGLIDNTLDIYAVPGPSGIIWVWSGVSRNCFIIRWLILIRVPRASGF